MSYSHWSEQRSELMNFRLAAKHSTILPHLSELSGYTSAGGDVVVVLVK